VNRYDGELANLPATYSAALAADIGRFKAAIAGACESSIIGVGTGGSFTASSLLCRLHEAYTGRVSRPATSLEVICSPNLAAASPVFLISAEGKNPDIVEALQRARRHSARAIHALTNHRSSPFIEHINKLTGISTHLFELAEKDGYLATNSLLLNAVVIARAYGELDQGPSLPASMHDLRIGEQTVSEWLTSVQGFIEQAIARSTLIVTYSPLLQPVAADLESKLAEAAILNCQVADLRSLAHGRHLWFAERPAECAVLALLEPSLAPLWNHMRAMLPTTVPTATMSLAGGTPLDLLAGLVAEMHLVGALAHLQHRDVGHPDVPQFGRSLYYVDLPQFIPKPSDPPDRGEQSKSEALGARWPATTRRGFMRRSRDAFQESLERQLFRALVFDYDGTLCISSREDAAPPVPVIDQLNRLLSRGVIVAIASGRGGSLQERLRSCLPEAVHPNVHLGLYSGGRILTLNEVLDQQPTESSEFVSHVTRILHRLQTLGVPIDVVRPTHPYQVSVRFREGLQTEGMWFVVADALRQAGLNLSSIVRSRHSVDILAPGVDKSRLIAHLILRKHIAPDQVLTIGDQGAWPGNDCSLLEHRFSLSVDTPSRRLDRGWKLAPPYKRDVDATLWYLDQLQLQEDGRFRMTFTPPTVVAQ
jgi:HAD superfamily hydrolase (TIGR01484 family)